ncbi:beta-N-acetylhexosaminidase [Amnibacterium sp. CER49]|uniref:beta-N-acetylhexosaminidase n=1 Tax=Amnibacterium sp. CER49 TaxID=3039161 RepID=UPI002446F5AB|nr:beta-N-acetylhexosaminidase [Amnibacterium sp. CER49]MDH2442588.1 beta-N-acetylhexosaminidase [Amnibacterium sp. CER49]
MKNPPLPTPSLIPSPADVSWGDDVFLLPAHGITADFGDLARSDRSRLVRVMSFLPPVDAVQPGASADLRFELTTRVVGAEAYELEVSAAGIRISGSTADGLHYGLQSLRQLLPAQAFSRAPLGDVRLRTCTIQDAPALPWRGALLDVARRFFPKRFLLHFVDTLAAHKINRLHLHLTDDQGWRVESHAFPRLNSVGSVRAASQVTHFDEEPETDGTPHGGFYSSSDLAELVSYAADRGIVVIPEIELPGHSGALLASYPEFGPQDESRSVLTHWGISNSLVSPLPEVQEHLRRLLTEVLAVFPSPWIHLGGDETRLGNWERDPAVSEYMRREGIASVGELFNRFMTDLGAWLTTQGRVMVMWDDAFANSPDDAPPAVVTCWRGTDVARQAAERGHDVVLAPVFPTYLDYYQAADEREPLAIGGPITLEDAAGFDPLDARWGDEVRSRVLGMQFQLWTEMMESERHVEYMAWPRACALAEAAWTGRPAASTPGFLDRLADHLPRLAALGIEYRPLDGPHPWQEAGTGRRHHRVGLPIAEIRGALSQAAEDGATAVSLSGERLDGRS